MRSIEQDRRGSLGVPRWTDLPELAEHLLYRDEGCPGGNAQDAGTRGIFPASREKAGNFIGSGLRHPHMASKKPSRSITHSQIPYAPEQGIDGAVAGNLVRSSRKSSFGSGKTHTSSCPSVNDQLA